LLLSSWVVVVFVAQKCQRYRSLEFRISQGCEKPVMNSVFWLSGRKKDAMRREVLPGRKIKGGVPVEPWYTMNTMTYADVNVRILEWDYEIYFHMIWSSPPCTEYNRIQHCKTNRSAKDCRSKLNNPESNWDYTVEYFNPKSWFIEKPQTGLLKQQEFMNGKLYKDVDSSTKNNSWPENCKLLS
jgi:hypothetical protein